MKMGFVVGLSVRVCVRVRVRVRVSVHLSTAFLSNLCSLEHETWISYKYKKIRL